MLFFTSWAHLYYIEHNPVENNTVYGRPTIDQIQQGCVPLSYWHKIQKKRIEIYVASYVLILITGVTQSLIKNKAPIQITY